MSRAVRGAYRGCCQNGATGSGGMLNVTNSGSIIIINGDNSVALYTQSVGGGAKLKPAGPPPEACASI